jgi:transposase
MRLVGLNADSLDLRQKILQAYAQPLGSQRPIATLCGVSQACVEKLRRRRRRSGDIAPRPHAGGRRALCDEAAHGGVRQLVQAQPNAPLAELCEQLSTQRHLRISVPTRARLVTHLGLPRQKSRSTPMSAPLNGSSKRVQPLRTRSPRSPPSAAN